MRPSLSSDLRGRIAIGAAWILRISNMLLIASKSIRKISILKNLLNSEFEMEDLGRVLTFLGMNIKYPRNSGVLTVYRKDRNEKVLE